MRTLNEAIADFLIHLSIERNVSHYTVRNYRNSLSRLMQSQFGDTTAPIVTDLRPDHIRSYIRYLHTLGFKPKTIYTELCAVRSFTKFLITCELINKDPCEKIAHIKYPDKKPNPFREDELQKFYDAINRSTITGRRDYVIFQLSLRTGLRSAEIVSLTVHDINLYQALLYVREGKGGKDRVVPLSSTLCTLLNDYLLNVRPELVKNRIVDHLFITKKHHPLWDDALRQMAIRYAMKAGLRYRQVSPHVFRYTFATMLARKSKADITVIKELLGHSSIQTTARYVGVVEEEKRRAVEGLDI